MACASAATTLLGMPLSGGAMFRPSCKLTPVSTAAPVRAPVLSTRLGVSRRSPRPQALPSAQAPSADTTQAVPRANSRALTLFGGSLGLALGGYFLLPEASDAAQSVAAQLSGGWSPSQMLAYLAVGIPCNMAIWKEMAMERARLTPRRRFTADDITDPFSPNYRYWLRLPRNRAIANFMRLLHGEAMYKMNTVSMAMLALDGFVGLRCVCLDDLSRFLLVVGVFLYAMPRPQLPRAPRV